MLTKSAWYPVFQQELLEFPAGRFGDQVDCLSLMGQMLDVTQSGNAIKEAAACFNPAGDGYRPIRDEETLDRVRFDPEFSWHLGDEDDSRAFNWKVL